jgi:hypothetical protein
MNTHPVSMTTKATDSEAVERRERQLRTMAARLEWAQRFSTTAQEVTA